MHRAYDVRTVALATGTTVKWVDNLLSHHDVPGVLNARQGVERRVSDGGLFAIEMTRILNREFGVPVRRAVALVRAFMPVRGPLGGAAASGHSPGHYSTVAGAGDAGGAADTPGSAGRRISVPIARGVALDVDVASIERRLRDQLVAAMESVPRIRRGRPPRAGRASAAASPG